MHGTDPLAVYGPHAMAGLARVDAMPNCGDLVVLAEYDPLSGETHAFEDQVGSHGGLGGLQADAFILHPKEWRFEEPIVGAPALYDALRERVRRVGSADARLHDDRTAALA